MNIELKKLELLNFKGIKELNIDFAKETSIYGENATGKTTVFDAFTWLLFGKDSTNRSDFNIKIINKNGETIHGLNDQVTGTLIVGDKEVILRRALKENWVKKRGSSNLVFSGNTTEYFINEVPKKEKEYKEYINSIIDENVFKLLTNPLHFNINTSWQDRRKILLSVIGDISDDDVINTSKDLVKLKKLLNSNSIEDFKAIIASKKKKLNEQLKAIPIRIDEINRNLPVLAEGVDYDGLEKEKAEIKGKISDIDNKLCNQRKIADDFNQRQQELFCMKSKLKDMETQIEKKAMKKFNMMKIELMQLENDKKTIEKMLENGKENIAEKEKDIIKFEEIANALRNKFKKKFTDIFIEPDRDSFICPTCKQSLPIDDVENQIIEMKKNYENEKNLILENVKQQGKEQNHKIKTYKIIADEEKENIKKYELGIVEINSEINVLQAQIRTEETNKTEFDYDSNEEYAALKNEIAAFEKKLVPLNGYENTSDSRIILDNRLNKINEILSNKKSIVDAQTRIKELNNEERKYAEQVAELEGQEFLVEEFVKTKVNMLEERINNTFKYVTFKMFDLQTNGGLNDTCQALVNGVPFADVNNAGKINAGIDIINALSKVYKITAPIFIDNRESVVDLIDTKSQVINLIVSKKDKKLRIEAA
nr:AAA family ATPase [Sedimentibacter sp.]